MFAMTQHHKYDWDALENMMPFERDVVVEMLMAFLEKEKEELEKRQR